MILLVTYFGISKGWFSFKKNTTTPTEVLEEQHRQQKGELVVTTNNAGKGRVQFVTLQTLLVQDIRKVTIEQAGEKYQKVELVLSINYGGRMRTLIAPIIGWISYVSTEGNSFISNGSVDVNEIPFVREGFVNITYMFLPKSPRAFDRKALGEYCDRAIGIFCKTYFPYGFGGAQTDLNEFLSQQYSTSDTTTMDMKLFMPTSVTLYPPLANGR